MTIDTDDKSFVNEVAKTVATELKPPPADENKEFLLHLYDALWENMRSKESRLWTFLSLYGAAVGLVFAGGQVSQTPGADLFAIVIVMGLTTWAVLIILNSIWWSARNQLMVSQIEKRYPKGIKGIVPRIYYNDPQFSSEQLSERIVLLLSLLLLLLFSRTLWSYHNLGSISNLQSLAVVILLYLFFILSAGYCLGLHESNIRAYYAAKKTILEDALLADPSTQTLQVGERLKLLADHVKVRQDLDVRAHVLGLASLVALLFDFIIYRNGVRSVWLAGIILAQVAAVVVFLVQRWLYRQPYSERDWKSIDNVKDTNPATPETLASLKKMEEGMRSTPQRTRLLVCVVLISAGLAAFPLYKGSQKLQEDWRGSKTVSGHDLGEQISKMQQDLQNVQQAFNEMQQSNLQLQKELLDQKLAPYTKLQEADQRFLTRDEFSKFRESQAKQKGKNQ
jgi:hypothetical protein